LDITVQEQFIFLAAAAEASVLTVKAVELAVLVEVLLVQKPSHLETQALHSQAAAAVGQVSTTLAKLDRLKPYPTHRAELVGPVLYWFAMQSQM
jgi:hypothetical protein